MDKDINSIIDNFLDNLSSYIEYQEELLNKQVKKYKTYEYNVYLLKSLHHNRNKLISDLVKDENQRNIFMLYMTGILTQDELKEFLNQIKNLYYLKSNNISSSLTSYQEDRSNQVINNFINNLNRYICSRDPKIYINNIKQRTDKIEKVMGVANDIEYNEAVEDIDGLQYLLEESSLSSFDKIKLSEYILNNNIKQYKSNDNNIIEELTPHDEKIIELEELMDTPSYLKKIISMIEDIPINKINLDNYKTNSKYNDDILVYQDYVRGEVEKILSNNTNIKIDTALSKFLNKNKKELDKFHIYYLHDTSYFKEDISTIDKNKVKEVIDDLSTSKVMAKKVDSKYTSLLTFDARTIRDKGLYITYIPINDNSVILLGITNKKLSDHNTIMNWRINKQEEDIITLMTKVIRREDLTSEKRYSKSVYKNITKKDDIEILDNNIKSK